jgi:tRNA dimethylallyltransferase
MATPDSISVVPVLVGPTASGKTVVSLQLAAALGAEIISADSRQVYRFMDIGTAKPTREERELVRHHFVDEINPDEEFSAGTFGRQAQTVIGGIRKKGGVPLIVGGSGLYIRALIDGLFDGPSADHAIRADLLRRAEAEGGAALLEELRMVDPDLARTIRPSNIPRMVRALEVWRLTGRPMSVIQKQIRPVPFRPLLFGLRWEREALYHRINLRVEQMFEQGLVDEVIALRRRGFDEDLPALRTVGYSEVFRFLDGNQSMEAMVNEVKMNSRRYAKRQMTWFRPDERIRWIDLHSGHDLDAAARQIAMLIRHTSGA